MIYIWFFSDRYRVFEGNTKEDDLYLESHMLQTQNTKWKIPDLINANKEGKQKPILDFAATTGFCHLVSQNAVDKIGDLFSTYGELLPVNIIDKDIQEKFYLFRCTNIVDCLDIDKSQIDYSTINPENICSILSPVFFKDKVQDAGFFLVPQYIGGDIFVSEDIKRIVKLNKLKGMVLTEKMFDDKKPWIS